jgi:DNA polymerase II small subunit
MEVKIGVNQLNKLKTSEMKVLEADNSISSKIISLFAEEGYNVNPSAVEFLKRIIEQKNISPESFVKAICKNISSNSIIIGKGDIDRALKQIYRKKEGKEKTDYENNSVITEERGSCEVRIDILKDITGSSTCEGGLEDFHLHFTTRYEKLRKILRNRVSAVPIEGLSRVKAESVDVIGMVCDVRETKNGNYFIELEDRTGRIGVIASGKLKEIAMELLGDEVIAVSGRLRNRTIIANRIIFPDVPQNGRRVKNDFSIVFISDIHFGSNTFLEDSWNLFVKWLRGEAGNESMRELAESVRCVVVAGDIVDGVGIYPGQEKELEIFDIYGQYEEAASHFDDIPRSIKVVLSPGNHDAVRQAEPQPALPKEFSSLFPKNVMPVGNPAWVDVEGIKILVYHGRSIDDIILKIPRLDYSEPTGAVEEMLKRRHLVPMYGGRSPLAPEKDDPLVIDEIPDIVHTGHVHTYGAKYYRGVLMINSSTFQAQTEFQKKVNLNPMPGNVPVLSKGKIHRLRFYREA